MIPSFQIISIYREPLYRKTNVWELPGSCGGVRFNPWGLRPTEHPARPRGKTNEAVKYTDQVPGY